jgi:hypothetical protein
MPIFDSKDSQVQGRKNKVQTLAIPFTIVGSATPANVVATCDEPSLLFFKTEGVNGITTASGALDTGDTATYTVTPVDANGTFNMLLRVNEPVAKVVSARCQRLSAVLAEADDVMIAALGSATGIVVSTVSANKIMLTVDGELSLGAANTLNAMIQVSYIVAE